MFRWVGLGLAIVGGIMCVIYISAHNWTIAAIFGILFIIGLFVLNRPNL
jgi:membrane-bound ClpP family serine protease